MQKSSKEWLVPLTGVAFLLFLIASFIVQGEPKSADDPVNEIVDFYTDNKDAIQISAVLGVVAGVFLIFFGAYLRRFLEEEGGAGSMLPILALVGLTIVAIGGAIDGTILFATAEAADDIEPTSVQTLQALWDNDFLPLALGTLVFLWSTGICVIRTGVFPKWLGWIAILLGIVGVTPAGFVGAIGAALLVVVFSILMSMRARSASATA